MASPPSDHVDRTIVFVGRTGSGKSTLCNVLAEDHGLFPESNRPVAETKSVAPQIVTVTFAGRSYRIRLVDTIGLDDNELSEEIVLYELATLCTVCDDGIHQIFFVTKDKFTKEEMAAFNLVRAVLFDEEVIAYTTAVRTNSEEFQKPQKVRDLKEDLERLYPELKDAKSFLAVDNTTQKSGHQGWRERREASRKLLLSHVILNCEKPYKPPRFKEVRDKVQHHISATQRLEKKLKDLEEAYDQQKVTHVQFIQEQQAVLRQREEENAILKRKLRDDKWKVAIITVGEVFTTAMKEDKCVIL